jgi:uncharacterized protein (TIGR03067 family)
MRGRMLTVLAAGLLVAADAPGDAAKQDAQALQGGWALVSGEYSRGKFSPEEVRKIRADFRGDTVVFKLGDETLKSLYKLDPTQKPKVIDLTSTDSRTRDRTYLGIYSLEGDTLKICFSESEQERPKEFAAEGQPGVRTLFVLRREKK